MGNALSTHGRANRNTEASTDKALPPPYDEELQPSKIKGSDVPQWRWSNKQCREWIAAVLVEYGNLEQEEADLQAQKFEGFGPNLFYHTSAKWVEWFGQNGKCLHCFMYEDYWKKGAVPKGYKWPDRK